MFRILFVALCFSLSAHAADTTYTETPVVLHTSTGDIFGTLTLPASTKKIPVALIIAGSGPTDRNGNNPMMKNESLHNLALALAEAHIASVRFDKRGVAESMKAAKSESALRFEDYINDAAGWITMLKIDGRFSKVVVIGHSEGSLIGMIAAQKNAAAFVSIAGAGRSADKVLHEQLGAQPPMVKDLALPILDSLAAGYTVSNVNPVLFSLFRPSVQPYLISWFKYDPAAELKKLSVPVLIVQGTNDIQVSVDDAKQLAAAQPKAKLLLVENMNHVFRIVEGDRAANVATYSKILPNSEVLTKGIVDFVKRLK